MVLDCFVFFSMQKFDFKKTVENSNSRKNSKWQDRVKILYQKEEMGSNKNVTCEVG